ncbi:hypothetical protein R3P38DRAFT_3288273 [Favolaschia claudopus]|uniref:Uncharacterized protein n=1 Tax=Favolaschia claudopus TaxID=2862362 RepID=A0AAV9ZXH3_9AGAR
MSIPPFALSSRASGLSYTSPPRTPYRSRSPERPGDTVFSTLSALSGPSNFLAFVWICRELDRRYRNCPKQSSASLGVSADPARYRCLEEEPRERAPALRSRTASLTSSRRVNSRMRAAGAAAPCAAGELLVGGEGEGGVEEAGHRFGYDAGGDFGIEGGEGGVLGGGEEEGEGGGEVVGAVGADEGACRGSPREVGVKQGRVRVMGGGGEGLYAPRPSIYLTIHRGSR